MTVLLGKDAPGLSASTISRLKEAWKDEHQRWSRCDLSNRHYVYLWVDGIHFGVRLEEAAQCILVVVGATPEGKKELGCLVRWLSGKRGLLAGIAARAEVGAEDRAPSGDRRWRLGLLESPAAGVRHDPASALLGAQDGQHPEQAAQAPAARRKPHYINLDGGDPAGGGESVRSFSKRVPAQVSQSRGMPGEGP
ncbi:transposase (plasmid) [Candidatus Methylocalor cossyra]|uniref:Mutator family transposase n=1 Tax=Candidatus Methylocalor cossyra TaxID=3108543 RepID=A0ABP1CFZ0_9GAMM